MATPTERKLSARIAGLTNAATHDMRALGSRGAAGLMERFRQEADPDGKLPVQERERKALLLRKAHYSRIALKSVQKRQRKAAR